MAEAITSPLILRIARSTQSGSKAMTAAWAAVYSQSGGVVTLMNQAKIDLTNMAAGDTVEIRVREQLTQTGNLIVSDHRTYIGARPATNVLAKVDQLISAWGLSIDMRQTAGVLKTFDTEFWESRSIGT